MHDDDEGGSEPCFAHHLVGKHPVDPQTVRDVARFRRAERQRLIAARGLGPDERARATAALIEGLDRIIGIERGLDIALYWPIRSEPDLRRWMHRARADLAPGRGGSAGPPRLPRLDAGLPDDARDLEHTRASRGRYLSA